MLHCISEKRECNWFVGVIVCKNVLKSVSSVYITVDDKMLIWLENIFPYTKICNMTLFQPW
jgi:hypothetical protein